MKRLSLLSMILILPGLLWSSGCKQSASVSDRNKKEKSPLVKVQPVIKDDISRTLELTGECLPVNSVTLSSTAEGPVNCCLWREGDNVEQGSVLVQIDRPQYREEMRVAEAALAVAEAKLKDLQTGNRPEEISQAREMVNEFTECTAFAQKDMERCAELVKNGAIPGEAYEKAKVAFTNCQTKLNAARERLNMLEVGPTATEIAVQQSLVKEARAKLDLARAKLAECTITAPLSGIITKVYFRPGDLAKAKVPLLEMIDPASIVIRFAVPEAMAAKVKKGMIVLASIDAYQGQTFQAQISHLYPELDPRMRTRTVEAIVKEGPQLQPGMFARLKVVIETAAQVPVIPSEAVIIDIKGDSIAFVVENGQAVKRLIKKGIEERGRVQILEGLADGERVIVAGMEKLKDGATVRVPEGKKNKPDQGMGGGPGK